ncbi:MAG: Crp/Fnr family transcriptional regulator [Actinomycetota bacterium]
MTVSPFLPARPSEMTRHQFARRSLLPLRGDSLWQIEIGAVRTLTWLEDGTTITLGFWGPGNVIGKNLSQINPYQMECITKVEAVAIPTHNLPQITDALILNIKQGEEFMAIRGYKKVDVMLLRLLSWLATRFGHEVEKGQLIDLRLTHQDLADLLGTTRVTITRMFKKFEQQGLIHRFSQHRIILQEEELWHYEI